MLSAAASSGVSNRVEDTVFEQGDLAESWSEGNLHYATVAIRFRARDYAVRLSDGAVVEGDASEPVQATEVWTFLRSGADGRWLLSAIQQV
jgi:predicted lipid-binding transport protein (Tim44 family)